MSEPLFNPGLRLARFLPRSTVGPRTLGLIRKLEGLGASRPPSQGTIVHVDADVSVRVFRPASARNPAPALLWIHGGGYVVGTAAMGDRMCRHVAEHLEVVAVSVEYRRAPEHPFPAPLHDCYTALRWLAGQPDVDPTRVAIAGESAGGGLAAALALLARERTEVTPVAQVLSYPMIDDRTTARTDVDRRRLRIWSQESNRFGWQAYLGPAATGDVPALAAPARYEDLSGLPPAWIGVGTNDLFYDEDVAYAERLRQAGVPCTLHVVPGAYHNFDVVQSRAAVSRAFRRHQVAALDDALNGDGRTLT